MRKKIILALVALWVTCSSPLLAQPEVMAWGNIIGIRIDGQLIDFESSLAVAGKDGAKTAFTGKERQNPMYTRDGKSQTVATAISGIRFTQTATEKGKGIADYLVALKTIYGVEATAFSFNESDIGIDVYHTPAQHAYLIKTLGAYFASRGLSTKLLLGDNSDATTFDFILPALNDPATYPYIYAVSFHSWRGCDDHTLNNWAWAARQINVPLIIGEGSTDAAAHRYSQIFAEATFALYDINLYTRIAAICQPQPILQRQLTSDYSILWGDGIYSSTGLLRPTQRFWNLKLRPNMRLPCRLPARAATSIRQLLAI
ncbi:MAG: hypothetical protein LBO71_10825 [Prevotellaceae bacterium]|nr:hypothetical protein [Prevotellaceae bacterium]